MMRPLWPLALLLLAGCAGPAVIPVASPESTWAERAAVLAEIEAWKLAGRVSITDGNAAWHLKLFWEQWADGFRMDLSGPFGAGAVKLYGNRDGVLLRDADGHHWRADDAEQLLWQHTGIFMPVGGLRYWIRGLPTPEQDTRDMELDAAGRLARLRQNGWTITFREYLPVDGLELPCNLLVQRDDIEVRVVVDRWQLPDGDEDSLAKRHPNPS